jgi:photosystem II stability/assembly factor-like uncharacterized protein
MIAPFARSLALLALGATGLNAAGRHPDMLLLDGAEVPSAIVVVGERGTVLRSVDHGATWSASEAVTGATLTGVTFAPDGMHGWAVGHDALILATSDAGETWRQQWQGKNLEDSFLDVLALDRERVIAVGAYGLLVSTRDGGRTWDRRKIADDDYHLNRISRGPTGTLYLAGERGTLLRSRDAGERWERIDSPYDGSFYGILPLGPRTLVAYGIRGRIFRSIDDGASWVPVRAEIRALIATAAVRHDGALIFAGQSRAWLTSTDGGMSVASTTAPLTSAVAELLALADGALLALGEAGPILIPPR